jgi:predicted secreted protein
MLKRNCNLILLLFFISSFQFCSLTQIKDESPKINVIKNGTKFRINLPENHSTGYIWQLNENYNKNLISDIGAVWHGDEKGIDFNLKALSIGQTTLSLTLRKYTDTLSNKTYVINIVDK